MNQEQLSLMAALQKGGPVMVVLALLSLYSIGAIIYKIVQFHRTKLLFRGGGVDAALIEVGGSGEGALATLIATLPEGYPAREIAAFAQTQPEGGARFENVAAYGNAIFRRLETHLRALEIVGAVSPMMGLLGTVAGMAGAFSGISSYGAAADVSALAAGIWEALLTTIAGLVVAIPAMAASYLLNIRLDDARQVAQDVVNLMLAVPRPSSEVTSAEAPPLSRFA